MDTLKTTRIAPSPTGALHLGNARTFLANWALARQLGWRIVLRIDDLDSPRVKAGAVEETIEVLQWLGIDWDEGPVFESNHLKDYRAALKRLGEQGLIYGCQCTRSQMAAASLSAPHADQHELRYPGTCRPADLVPIDVADLHAPDLAWRVRVADEWNEFNDEFAGSQRHHVQREVGDFLVTNKQGIASYQLACVVDDGLANVSYVVRGDDLLASTPRQMILQRYLGLPPCKYWHLPLIVGADGRRLAKRHGDTTIKSYRQQGVSAARIRGLMAAWCGKPTLEPCSPSEFIDEFSLQRFPRNRIVFDAVHDHWLLHDNN
ncbi:MAG TPA: tRNA glutamyl-Q(34) synthetase GluQRS [Pirellulaceae bacterium]|nr:tRNA glutamyl-Q(34) synthetase GluQRS [Pirellulaceae bacterium]HMO91009.1 tRNA glutamyl-Q(34) synthetase GluQRS [Pirellulaceae bacterium]HMP68124.1 tRNA glutamyl-Q(34) synthetase GluQRS [Pirellulaceae bacterium]